jgi:hypothetical protein
MYLNVQSRGGVVHVCRFGENASLCGVQQVGRLRCRVVFRGVTCPLCGFWALCDGAVDVSGGLGDAMVKFFLELAADE